jgi:putative transposase
MLTTYQFRLYPSKTQVAGLEATLQICRRFHNDLLAERKNAWEGEQRSVTKTEQFRRGKALKDTSPSAEGVHSHILQVVVGDVAKAFDAFFRRVKNGEKPGYPRFKGPFRFDSFGLKEYGNGFKLDGRRLSISGIGRIAVRWHRPIEGAIKTVRLIRKADGWYACFSVEEEPKPLPETGEVVGIDVGVTALLTTSQSEKTQNPRWYRKAQAKLRAAQRRVARRKKGGMNRRKAVGMLQREHQRIQNRRRDFLNKVVFSLVQRYDGIALEDLSIANMVQNHCLSKSILDAGWGYLASQLTHKAAEAGRVVEFVDPAYTSKTCSCCGKLFDNLTLKDRWVTCSCGLSMDRDENAALNILKRSRFGRCRDGWGGTRPFGCNVGVVMPSVSKKAAPL